MALFGGVSGKTTVQDLLCFCMHMVGMAFFVYTHTVGIAGLLRTHGPRENKNLPLTCPVQRFWEI